MQCPCRPKRKETRRKNQATVSTLKCYIDITCSIATCTFEVALSAFKTTVMHWCSCSATLTHASSALLNKTHEKQSRRSICSQYFPSNTISLKICTESISHKSVTLELNTLWEIHAVYMSNIHLYWGERAQHSWALISISSREAYSAPSWRSFSAFLL